MNPPKRVLSVFSLVMINVIAVDNLRTLPVSAQLGFSLIYYYAIAALCFFIPIALVAAELSTTYPHTGGLYVWVREAFGRKIAFLTIWLQWVYNIVWYPTILVFIVTAFAYLISPSLAQNKIYLLSSTLSLFWLMTLLNCFGMRISGFISILGAILGTLIPMIGIAGLGIYWVLMGHPIATPVDFAFFSGSHSFMNQAGLFCAVLFGLLGIEMSGMHAEEVKNPKVNYPKALFYSMLIIFSTLVLGSLAIIVVIPAEKLNIISGLIDAYALFFKTYHLEWLTQLTVVFIILGGLSGVSAWIIGPTKGLLVAARDGCIPQRFTHLNQHGAPVRILITQGIIYTVLSSIYVLSDSIDTAYWILTILCSQLALFVYIFMFAAAIQLRYKYPHQKRPYQIPGGKFGIWAFSLTGLTCCLAAIAVGFIPTEDIKIHNPILFECTLVAGLVFFITIPWFILKKQPILKSN